MKSVPFLFKKEYSSLIKKRFESEPQKYFINLKIILNIYYLIATAYLCGVKTRAGLIGLNGLAKVKICIK